MRSSKNWMSIDFSEWYTCTKKIATKKFIAALDTNKELQVKRITINDIADKLKIEDKDDDKVVKMIFYRRLDDFSKVEVLVGIESH